MAAAIETHHKNFTCRSLWRQRDRQSASGPTVSPDAEQEGLDMNSRTSGRRATSQRTRFLGAAVTCAALLAAGCSSPSSNSGNNPAQGGNGKTRYQQAVAYAQCIRSHGYPAFPDPLPNGSFPNNGSLDLSSPQYQAAAKDCKNLEPAPNSSQYEAGYRAMLRYSACMRQNGVSAYPDPVLSNTGVGIPLKIGTAPGDVNTSSPQFISAEAKCRPLQPGGGNGGQQ
jgi:hypothetical protein